MIRDCRIRSRLRRSAVAALLVSWTVALMVGAPAAMALHREDGDDPGPQISTLKALLIFGVIPVGAAIAIALVVSLPSLARGPRYRPGLDWDGKPEWYGAPGAEQLSAPGGSGEQLSAGRKSEALTGRIVATGEDADAGDGGSSASW